MTDSKKCYAGIYDKFQEPTNFLLNTALCQFTAPVNKTQQSMDRIKNNLIDYILNPNKIHGIHHLQLIFTNNTLEETKQWNVRLGNEFVSYNVYILSSKSTAKFNKLSELINHLLNMKKAKDLPDIIVMCSHPQRFDDILELMSHLYEGGLCFNRIGIQGFRISISFDEADKSTGLISKFLKRATIKNYLGTNRVPKIINNVEFITATPFKNFWKMLEINNISSLNTKWIYDNYEKKNLKIEDINKGYIGLSNHTISIYDEYATNTLEYIKSCFNDNEYLSKDKKEGLNVFCPGKITTKTHNEICEYLNSIEYCCLLHNGKFKGFVFPNGERISIYDFNIKYGIKGELRDTLVKFREIYPKINLGITGFTTIERGITFNTPGFNFDYIILSLYHMNKLESLIQLLGRSSGSAKYIKPHVVICPKELYTKASTAINNCKELYSLKLDEVTLKDFNNIDKEDDNVRTVPKMYRISDEEYEDLNKIRSKKEKKEKFYSKIKELDEEWDHTFNSTNLIKISIPGKKTSNDKIDRSKPYIKYIINQKKNIQNNKKFISDVKGDDKEKNVWLIFIDKIEKCLIVLRYYGERIE